MNDMMGLGLMGMLGGGGGMGDFGMDQMGMGGAMGGGMPQTGVAGLFGGMGGMPMYGMGNGMPMMGLLGQLLMRKQQEERAAEEMKLRKEMFDRYLEVLKKRGRWQQGPLERPVAPKPNIDNLPLYSF
jgi:hypothetical protein